MEVFSRRERRIAGQRQKVSISEREMRGCWLTVRRHSDDWKGGFKRARASFLHPWKATGSSWQGQFGRCIEALGLYTTTRLHWRRRKHCHSCKEPSKWWRFKTLHNHMRKEQEFHVIPSKWMVREEACLIMISGLIITIVSDSYSHQDTENDYHSWLMRCFNGTCFRCKLIETLYARSRPSYNKSV